MWIIEYNAGARGKNGEPIISYFSKFGLWGMQEYSNKDKAMKFDTKKEAQLYIRQMLNRPSKHKAVKV